MRREQNPNLEILEDVVEQLGPLADEMVFLGGCATGLLLTDVAAPPIRATQDVDVITEVASLQAYHRLAEQLRERGFREDQSPDAPICRWTTAGLLLDVMPTDPKILGFGNPWYATALKSAVGIRLSSGRGIRMVTAPCFVATKLAAFDGCGQGDYLASHDIEDVIAVLDGRPELMIEILHTEPGLRQHLIERFRALLQERRFVDAIAGHLPSDAASQARRPIVLDRIQAIADSNLQGT